MKNIIAVFLSLFLITCTTLHSIAQAAVQSASEQEYQALENTFEADLISAQQLALFQKKSTQQLKDFLNTLELITSKDIDSSFYKVLKIKALNSFSNPSDSLFFLTGNKIEGIDAQSFIKNLRLDSSTFKGFKISNITFTNAKSLDKEYTWNVSFQYKQEDQSMLNFIASFILRKEEKEFGKTKRQVWQTFITEIKEVQ